MAVVLRWNVDKERKICVYVAWGGRLRNFLVVNSIGAIWCLRPLGIGSLGRAKPPRPVSWSHNTSQNHVFNIEEKIIINFYYNFCGFFFHFKLMYIGSGSRVLFNFCLFNIYFRTYISIRVSFCSLHTAPNNHILFFAFINKNTK